MKTLLFLTLLCLMSAASLRADTLEIVVLDVGEGQAVLLKREERGVLIDVGHAGMAPTVLNNLVQVGVSRLDRIILTHLHPDHASGYFRIREAFPDAVVHSNGDPAALNSQIDMVRWISNVLAADETHRILRTGDHFSWMDVNIETHWPDKPEGGNLNDNSLVLSIQFGANRAILMGDTGRFVEEQLLDDMRLPGDVRLLVAGHHGSGNTSHTGFLAYLKPDYCAVSVNKDNIRGYPDPSTIDRLQDHCTLLYRTDLDGNIHLVWPKI